MSSPAVSQITPRTNSSITPSTSTNTALLMNVNRSNNSSVQSTSSSITSSKNPIQGNSPPPTTKITKILTSREWVLPPRPKPGRKPSVDTPATKRKAQNRAAQRAFRERRANRVSELEVQILELEREKSIKEGILSNKIKSLSNENDFLKKSLDDLKSTVDMLKTQFNNSVNKINHNNISGKSPSNRTNSTGVSPTATTPSSLQNRKQSTGSSSASTPAFTNPSGINSSSSSVHDVDLNKAASMMINFKNSSRHGSFSQAPSPLTMGNGNGIPSPGMQRNIGSTSSYYQQQVSPYTIANSPLNSQDLSTVKNLTPVASSHQKIQSSHDDDCGICLKDDCICESIGIKEKKPSVDSFLNFGNFEPVAAVPLKRKREESSDGSFSLEIDFTQHFKKSLNSPSLSVSGLKKMPSLSKLTKSNNSNSNNNIKFNRQIGLMANDKQHYENESLFKSPSVSLDYDNSPSADSASTHNHNNNGNQTNASEDRISPEDQCGFCSDDSPCVCREIAKQKELTKLKDDVLTTQLNKISETKGEENYNDQQPSVEKDNSSCTGNPGTCLQCQADPMSTLFCTTIASKAEEKQITNILNSQNPGNAENDNANTTTSTTVTTTNDNSPIRRISSTSLISPVLPLPRPSLPTFGSNAFGSALSTSIPTPPGNNLPIPLTSNSPSNAITITTTTTPATATATVPSRSNSIIPSLSSGLEINNPGKHFIPCSDAYKTLSRHANFRNVGFNSIINKLNTNGMYVEVESIVKCLRELDRKFGSN